MSLSTVIPASHVIPHFPADDSAHKKEYTCSRPLEWDNKGLSTNAKHFKKHYPNITFQALICTTPKEGRLNPQKYLWQAFPRCRIVVPLLIEIQIQQCLFHKCYYSFLKGRTHHNMPGNITIYLLHLEWSHFLFLLLLLNLIESKYSSPRQHIKSYNSKYFPCLTEIPWLRLGI